MPAQSPLFPKKFPNWLSGLLAVGIVTLGAGTTFRLSRQPGSARAGIAGGRAPAPTGTLYRQFQEDLDRVFAERAQSESRVEWQNRGFLPTDIVMEAIALKDPSTAQELCKALSELPAPELSIFDQAISIPAHSRFLPCFNSLRRKIEAHWDRHRAQFATRLSALAPAQLEIAVLAVNSKAGAVIGAEEIPRGQVALVFDGGPDPYRTPRILQILKEAGAPAAFFMSGALAQQNSALAQLVHQEGFAIGTVGWSNRPIPKLSVKDADREMERGRSGVASASGTQVKLFRFPLDEISEFYQNFVAQKKLATLVSSLPADDWKLNDPSELLAQILGGVDRQQGGVLVLHDSLTSTEVLLPVLLRELALRRIRLVTFE